MNERIRELRKELKLSMEGFGKLLGVQKGAIFKIEHGENNVSEQMVSSILNVKWPGNKTVNADWLRYGRLPMFAESSRKEQIKDWVDKILTEEPEGYKVRLASGLAGLDEAGWKAVYSLALAMVRGIEDSGTDPSEDPRLPSELDDDAQIEMEAEMVKESYIQSQKAKRSTGSSGGSISTA